MLPGGARLCLQGAVGVKRGQAGHHCWEVLKIGHQFWWSPGKLSVELFDCL